MDSCQCSGGGVEVVEGINGLTKELKDQLHIVDHNGLNMSNGYESVNHSIRDFGDFPVSIKKDEVFGRYLVAKRDISAGQIILKDKMIFISPNAGTKPTCLGCCLELKSTINFCSKCGWPICGPECEILPDHADFECKIFSKNGIRPSLPPPLCFIAGEEYIKVLRGLLLSTRNSPEDQIKWKYFISLEAHLEARKSIPKIHFMSALSKTFIQKTCKLPFDDDLINLVLGVIDVNAFRHTIHPNNPLRQNISNSSKDIDRNATFIFPHAAMAAHGCRRNVRWETLPSGELEMWLAEDVKEGDLLTHPYVDLMLGTPDRRRQLKDQFYFDCACQRCTDPTEFNTFFSSLKCPECKPGYLLPVNPLDYKTFWKCNNETINDSKEGSSPCQCIKPSDYEREIVTQIQSEKKTILEMHEPNSNLATIGGLARMLGKYRGKKVHPNHYAIVDVEYNLVKRMARMSKPNVNFLQEMRRLIHKFLDLSVVFYPGIK